jgi:ribosomal protein S18 acetylase RimI-like enzyme
LIEIGELRAEEAEAAVALWEACGLTRPWNDPHADLRLALESPSSTVLAGRRDAALVATAMVGCDGHRGWVYYLAVAPEHRRAGHGAAMMRAAEGWLTARGAPKLNLMVRADNAAAAGFYEALGYARSDVLVMQRVLGEPHD